MKYTEKKTIFILQFDKVTAYVRVFLHFCSKFRIASLGNTSAEIGKIVDLRHEFYIAVCIYDVGSYDIFHIGIKKKSSHVLNFQPQMENSRWSRGPTDT